MRQAGSAGSAAGGADASQAWIQIPVLCPIRSLFAAPLAGAVLGRCRGVDVTPLIGPGAMKVVVMKQLLEPPPGRTPLESRMEPEGVVLPAPAVGQAVSLIYRGEQIDVQEYITHPSVVKFAGPFCHCDPVSTTAVVVPRVSHQ